MRAERETENKKGPIQARLSGLGSQKKTSLTADNQSYRGTNREPQNKGNLIHQTLHETCKRPFGWALEPMTSGAYDPQPRWLLGKRGGTYF